MPKVASQCTKLISEIVRAKPHPLLGSGVWLGSFFILTTPCLDDELHIWRIFGKLKRFFRQRDPRLGITRPNVRHRCQRRGVVKRPSINRNHLFRSESLTPKCCKAFWAPKNIPLLSVRFRSQVGLRFSFNNGDAPIRHLQRKDKTGTTGRLAFRAMAAEERDRLGGNFISDRSADAASS
jgi:hypothetical protein